MRTAFALFVAIALTGCAQTTTAPTTTAKASTTVPAKVYTCKMLGTHRGQHTVIIVTENCLADRLMTLTVVVTSKNGHAAGREAHQWKTYYLGKKNIYLLFRLRAGKHPMLVFGTRVPKKQELRWRNPPTKN